jgi:hypothetical protein
MPDWSMRYIARWADVKPSHEGSEHESRFRAGANDFGALETPLDFASLYVTAKCHLRCVH